MRGGRWPAILITVVVTSLTAVAPASACDWVGFPYLDEIRTAVAEDEPLVHFREDDRVIGMQLVEVLARAPALVPVTSSRAGSVVIRSWGEEAADARGALHPDMSPYAPFLFIGMYGHGCAPLTHPPAGTVVTVANVRTQQDTRAYLVSVRADADREAAYAVFDEAWGDAREHRPTATEHAAAWAYAWWPLAVTTVVLLGAATAFVRRLRRP